MVSEILKWLENHEKLALVISGASVLVFFAFLIAVPVILVKLPADYFQRPSVGWTGSERWSVSRIIYLIIKNMVGVVLLLAGILMLFLPGQGLISMVMGFSLLDLPFKRRIVRRIVCKPRVMRPLNRLRARFNRPAFEIAGKRSSLAKYKSKNDVSNGKNRIQLL